MMDRIYIFASYKKTAYLKNRIFYYCISITVYLKYWQFLTYKTHTDSSFFNSQYRAILMQYSKAIFLASKKYIFFQRREATAKIEFKDNFRIKATTNLVLCRRAVCNPFCSEQRNDRWYVVCRSQYMRICMRACMHDYVPPPPARVCALANVRLSVYMN